MVVVEYSILQCMFFSWKYIDFTEKCCCLFVFFFVVTNLCIVPSNILSFSLLLVVVSICILFTNRKKPLIFFFEIFLNFRNFFFLRQNNMHTIQGYTLSSSTGELCLSLQRKRSGCFQCLKKYFGNIKKNIIKRIKICKSRYT